MLEMGQDVCSLPDDSFSGRMTRSETKRTKGGQVMNRIDSREKRTRPLWILALALAGVLGCSEEMKWSSSPDSERVYDDQPMSGLIAAPLIQDGSEPPPGLVPITVEGRTLNAWPYTGESFNGAPSDPVNLVFVGKSDPAQIRAALLALDGDRSAFGFPPVAPFNARWKDAEGGVQTAYSTEGGWSGSVIQLALGDFGPVRTHLRLFRTGAAFGSDGVWTLGGAHFEVLIPSTTEHQVLSWELAQQIVTVDLMRSGLLVASGPGQTGTINQAPSFREIPDFVYNQLPPELIAVVGGPPQPVSGAVPIASDGVATVLHLASAPAVAADSKTETFTVEFGQVIPKPLCSDGPLDWVHVTGPVTFQKSVSVDEQGRYQYTSRASGRLTVTPVDITTNPPTPGGTSFEASVSESQDGFLAAKSSSVSSRSRRLAPQPGGAEILNADLRVSPGGNQYRLMSQCLQPAP